MRKFLKSFYTQWDKIFSIAEDLQDEIIDAVCKSRSIIPDGQYEQIKKRIGQILTECCDLLTNIDKRMLPGGESCK